LQFLQLCDIMGYYYFSTSAGKKEVIMASNNGEGGLVDRIAELRGRANTTRKFAAGAIGLLAAEATAVVILSDSPRDWPFAAIIGAAAAYTVHTGVSAGVEAINTGQSVAALEAVHAQQQYGVPEAPQPPQ
jgi:hypothetical protein